MREAIARSGLVDAPGPVRTSQLPEPGGRDAFPRFRRLPARRSTDLFGMVLRHRVLSVLLAVLGGTLLLGFTAPGLGRPFFVLGAALAGFLAYRESASRSVEVAIALFSFAPMLRRIVDVGAGYDASAWMLLGPILAIAIPIVDLRHLLFRRSRDDASLMPMLIVLACITYGALISAFAGNLFLVLTILIKTIVPLLYGIWILCRAQTDDRILEAASRAFFVVTPIMGAYGIVQYVNPLEWDRYWMLSSAMVSIGIPEPFQIRVFSTMNSPASYAIYSVCGLLLFGFCRSGWLSVLLAGVVSVGLLLSLYRTAWLALFAGMAYAVLFNRTRGRAGLIAGAVVVATLFALSLSDFGDVIAERLGTLTGSVSEDGSGKVRLEQIVAIYQQLDNLTFGWGYHALLAPFDGIQVADGEVVQALLVMGVLVGSIYLAALAWAIGQALSRVNPDQGTTRIVAGAMTLGVAVQIPLGSATSGELGFVFWLLIAVTTACPARRSRS